MKRNLLDVAQVDPQRGEHNFGDVTVGYLRHVENCNFAIVQFRLEHCVASIGHHKECLDDVVKLELVYVFGEHSKHADFIIRLSSAGQQNHVTVLDNNER
jgi:hypothetical protein